MYKWTLLTTSWMMLLQERHYYHLLYAVVKVKIPTTSTIMLSQERHYYHLLYAVVKMKRQKAPPVSHLLTVVATPKVTCLLWWITSLPKILNNLKSKQSIAFAVQAIIISIIKHSLWKGHDKIKKRQNTHLVLSPFINIISFCFKHSYLCKPEEEVLKLPL